ncbi:hypothetical protein [Histidinibacterium lentulum]|uniref:Uncharacterized protein n=1 Tax=Histidinibacterium lentulum TaxID=2480588 RepID=A0A3N2R4V8_9RHOB|nr:hypothetical protein [Histidinibacterium lentulum]ROU02530.1 hypothetical protein EAT49_09340 [Histidinibacterium lentulum]
MARKPTDWPARYRKAKPPHVVTLPNDFAGVKAGQTMLISSPEEIGRWIDAIPRGETRTILRMRTELARRAGADAMCPVTASIYLRVVAECALKALDDGQTPDAVTPFWRVIGPGDRLAAKLSCGTEGLVHLRALDSALDPA